MPHRLDLLVERLTHSRALGLYSYNTAFERSGQCHVEFEGRRYLMASSYDYLSLIGHPRIEQAAIAAISRRGTATGGVRLLTGTIPEHCGLERQIAQHYGAEDCVTFSAGYFANIGAMAAFGGPAVTAHVDALAHRSVLDACTLAGSRIRRFRHNDADDLERRLKQRPRGDRAIVFIESLYSMDGDIAPVARIAEVANAAGAPLIVDDAHGLGVLEPPGAALAGAGPSGVSAWVGSLSKAVPSNGGFVATDAATADRIRHLAGPYIFSAASTPAAVAAAAAAIEVIGAEGWRRDRLRANIRHFRAVLPRATAAHDPASPIFPIYFADDDCTLRAAAALRAAGIIASPIVSPAVGPNRPRLRICVNAAHQLEDLELLARAIGDFDAAAGLVPETGPRNRARAS